MKKVYCIGDIHGDIDRFKLLLSNHNLIDDNEDWNAGNATFVSIGDVTDRGKHGIEVIQFIQKLETQADEQGGEFITICGNHDALILAQAFQENSEYHNPECTYLFNYNGGNIREAEKMAHNESLFNWMQNRPQIFQIGNLLFQHADTAKYYLSLGRTVEDINKAGFEKLKTGAGAYSVFYDMCDCRFWDRPYILDDNLLGHIEQYLDIFNADMVIHGHTRFVGNEPQIYGDNKIINVDGSLSNGYRKDPDRGFIISFSEVEEIFTFDKTQV